MFTVGIIGLGNMGAGMALALRKHQLTVFGYDPDSHFKEELQTHGVELTSSIQELSSKVEVILTSLPTSESVEAVILSDGGVLDSLTKETYLLETSSIDPETTRVIAKKAKGSFLHLMDGPVSGGAAGARSGTMTMYIGGDGEDVKKITPLLNLLTKNYIHVGPIGAGHTTKLINNLLCGLNLLAVGEVMELLKEQPVNLNKIFEGISLGSGRSGVTEVNYPEWIANRAFNSGFTMKLMRKDLRLAQSLLEKNNKTLPLLTQTLDLWQQSEEKLIDELDFNKIVDLYRSNQ